MNEARPDGGRTFWVTAAVGWAVIAFGIFGLMTAGRLGRPTNVARFFIGAAVVHDFVLVPFVLVVGVALRRLLPERLKAPGSVLLFATGTISLFAYPFIRGFGRDPADPSFLPLNYARGLAATLGIVLVVVAVWWSVAQWKRSRPAG